MLIQVGKDPALLDQIEQTNFNIFFKKCWMKGISHQINCASSPSPSSAAREMQII